jgi:hypothetical protein
MKGGEGQAANSKQEQLVIGNLAGADNWATSMVTLLGPIIGLQAW